MRKFKVDIEWDNGFKHTAYVHGSLKTAELEEQRLKTFNYIKKFKITEVKFNGYE